MAVLLRSLLGPGAAALLLAQEASAASCPAEDATCRAPEAEDDSDAIAALQVVHRGAALGREPAGQPSGQDEESPGHPSDLEERTAEGGEPRWRDAIQAEKEYFRRHASLLQSMEFEGHGAEFHTFEDWAKPPVPFGRRKYRKPPNVFRPQPIHVKNVEESPQGESYGPYKKKPWGLYDPPSEPMRTPKEVRSVNGVLQTTLVVSAGWIQVPGTGIRVRSRLFNGTYPGPTIRVRRGDLVNITVVNNLGKQRWPCTTWRRREGQATSEFPDGIPEDHPRYQDVGQSKHDPFNMEAKTNNMHNINVTNLHVHGWHVSPLEPQDNVLDVEINPGESYSYSYQLSPYHSSGNSWYHSHVHGSVTQHTIGGMMGALIIDDEVGESPDWIREAQEVVAVIHEGDWSYFGPKWLQFNPRDEQHQGCFPFGSQFTIRCALGHRAGLMANLSGDALYRMEYAEGFGYEDGEESPVTSMFSVNGQYRPTFEMVAGEWRRLRLIFASGNLPINLIFNDTSPCEMWLVAKDSAWIERYPRKLNRGVFMGAGNRAQVMIRCKRPGLYNIHSNMTQYFMSAIDPQQTVMFVKVTGQEATSWDDPQEVQAVRPRYLQSLVNLPSSELADPIVPPARNQYNGKPLDTSRPLLSGKTIASVLDYDFPGDSPGLNAIPASAYTNQPVRFVVNNMTFSRDTPQASFPVASVVELLVTGLEVHSWHMHVNPVQYVHFGEKDYKEVWGGFFEVGDWHDVLQLTEPSYDVREASAEATVRFQTDCYTGKLVLHCHVLYHEDLGMMTWFNTTGVDHTYNPHFKNEGVFADAPTQCMKPGQQCAPSYCTDYKYHGQPAIGQGGFINKKWWR